MPAEEFEKEEQQWQRRSSGVKMQHTLSIRSDIPEKPFPSMIDILEKNNATSAAQ
jgi:hypothetical protein